MKERWYDFHIFDTTIRSNIPLPELSPSTDTSSKFSFFLSPIPSSHFREYVWQYRWISSNGDACISVARTEMYLIFRFHNSADFLFYQKKHLIVCHPASHTLLGTIRHLFLDQVMPRIISYLGELVLHASGALISDSSILFLGQTGWGKSTLCGYLYQIGYPILGDDSILLKKTMGNFLGIPSYSGLRLFQDSFIALRFDHDFDNNISDKSYNSHKKRIHLNSKKTERSIESPIKVIFVLNDPKAASHIHSVTFSPLRGFRAVIQILKHHFQADPTDSIITENQLKKLEIFLSSNSLSIYSLNFQRDHKLLPSICDKIVSFVTSLP